MHLSLQSELLPRLSGRQPSQHAKQGLYESYTSVVCRVCGLGEKALCGTEVHGVLLASPKSSYDGRVVCCISIDNRTLVYIASSSLEFYRHLW